MCVYFILVCYDTLPAAVDVGTQNDEGNIHVLNYLKIFAKFNTHENKIKKPFFPPGIQSFLYHFFFQVGKSKGQITKNCTLKC